MTVHEAMTVLLQTGLIFIVYLVARITVVGVAKAIDAYERD